MRIALLTYSTRPRGGVVHTLALAEALARAGESVTVFGLGRGGDDRFFRPLHPAVTAVVVPFPDRPGEDVGGRVVRSIATLGPAVDRDRFDIVHAQDCITANAVPGSVRTVHHLDTFTTPELVACHEAAIVGPCAHVCVSQAVADELAAGWGITATVIPNGVDSARFAAAAGVGGSAERRRWRERLGGRYILAVGGIEPRKGSIELLAAVARLGPAHAGIPLVVAGGETLFDYRPYRREWEERAAALPTAPVVLGPVDHDRLPALVAAAAVFAFPSTREGFGLAALEAAAAGVPLVAADLPVLREVLGGAARFASGPGPLAAALADALDRPSPGLVAAGRARAAGYTWDAAAATHRRLYAALAGRPVPAG